MGGDGAFGRLLAGGVGAYPGDAFEGAAADLPAAGVEFEAERTAEVVQGEVDGAQVVVLRCGSGELGDVAPAVGAWRAVEVFFGEGVWSCGSCRE